VVTLARVGAVVSAWQDADREHIAGAPDARSVVRSEGARALIVERALSSAPAHEWFTAWLRYGRLLAEEDASTTLALATLGSLERVLPEVLALPPGGPAMLEGYVSVVRERLRVAADRDWDPPRCVVPTGRDSAAVCLPPFEERDRAATWAEDVARLLAKRGVRTVACEGTGPVREELDDALAQRGISIDVGGRHVQPGAAPGPPRRWRFWPFR
jgi:hypothetical protein